MLPYGRKNPLPFPFSKRSHVGNLRQTLQGKGVIHKRVETVGVYPLVPPPGRRNSPLRFSEKLPAHQERTRLRSSSSPLSRCRETCCRPEGANTLTQFEYPAQPVLKKSCRPSGANPLTQFGLLSIGVKNRGRPDQGKKLPFVNSISLVFSRPAWYNRLVIERRRLQ